MSAPPPRTASIGVWGNVGAGFAHPVDAALDPDTGHLLVLNRSTSWRTPHGGAVRISVLSHAAGDAEVLADIGRRPTPTPGAPVDGAGGPVARPWLTAPVGIAVRDGLVAVTDDHDHAVLVLTVEGEPVTRLGGPGTAPGRFRHPAGITATPDGLWVVDAGNARLQLLGWDGEVRQVIGSRGLGPGQLRHPWGASTGPDGELWVADWGNDRIQALDVDGRCLAVLGGSGRAPLHRPAAVVVDVDGTRHVADWGQRCVQSFDAAWRRLAVWHGGAAISPWARQRLEELPSLAELRDRAGDPGGEGLLGRPTGLCALPDGRVLVVDVDHHRLQTLPALEPAEPALG